MRRNHRGAWLSVAGVLAVALPFWSCAEPETTTGPELGDLEAAFAANNKETFSLVDGAKMAVLEVEGRYREYDVATNTYNSYDARGTFTIAISPVPTNDWELRTWGTTTYFDAYWENWSPTVNGTVVVDMPDGEVFFNYKSRGLTSYFGRESPYYNNKGLEVYSFMGTTGSGPTFNMVSARLRSTEVSEDALPERGTATVDAWAANELNSDFYLRGTYTLTDNPGGADHDGAAPATDFVTRRGKLPTYRVTDRGLHVVMDMEGDLRVRNDEGAWVSHAADATFTTTVSPMPSPDGTYYYYEGPSYWYERMNVWFTTPQRFQGEVTVHYPDGDVTFHVSFDNNISSGGDFYRNSYNPEWRMTLFYDWGFGVSESGNAPVDFYDNWGSLRGRNSEMKAPSTGTANISLGGIDARLSLRGEYWSTGS